MVKKNSIKINNEEIKFIVTDFKNEIFVSYKVLYQIYFQKEKVL